MPRPDPDVTATDPYAPFRFRLRWAGRTVAGLSRASGLAPGTGYRPVVLERGITHDPEFDQWAGLARPGGSGPQPERVRRDRRREVTLEEYDEAGERAVFYRIHQCWVSDYQAVPELDANANAVAVSTLALEHEGVERAADPAGPTG